MAKPPEMYKFPSSEAPACAQTACGSLLTYSHLFLKFYVNNVDPKTATNLSTLYFSALERGPLLFLPPIAYRHPLSTLTWKSVRVSRIDSILSHLSNLGLNRKTEFVAVFPLLSIKSFSNLINSEKIYQIFLGHQRQINSH